jgi:hypothetical protein
LEKPAGGFTKSWKTFSKGSSRLMVSRMLSRSYTSFTVRSYSGVATTPAPGLLEDSKLQLREISTKTSMAVFTNA